MSDPAQSAELVRVRARMVRNEIAPHQLERWWSPDTERPVDPMDDPETRASIKSLLADLWNGAL